MHQLPSAEWIDSRGGKACDLCSTAHDGQPRTILWRPDMLFRCALLHPLQADGGRCEDVRGAASASGGVCDPARVSDRRGPGSHPAVGPCSKQIEPLIGAHS